MSVRRVVPGVRSEDVAASRGFHRLLRFDVAMDVERIVTSASPAAPGVQAGFMAAGRTAAMEPV